MIRRLLVANRGEIAVRVARAARELRIAPLGIYSEADAAAYHLQFMDDARCVGPAPASQSYLDIGRVLDAARAMDADAVHPGYGFLSENAAFAGAVRDAGLVFVGPPPEAIAAAGSKIEAKHRARDAGVPTVPGYDGDGRTLERLRAEAKRVGFPLLIKASAGGGGRGMRIVTSLDAFDESLASAKREAMGAFGDDAVLLERYLRSPRHIEFQILADAHGTVLHLGERECSIQRRHQKIVEEAPSVAVAAELRARMGAHAITVAKSVGYVNAGTVEFMLDDDGYYFLEMNARLQVEHPVTEMTYGVDLVHWQLRIAAGERLSLRQEDLAPRGWAIEMRVTAEDTAHAMLPSSGRITRWSPPSGLGVRLDAGVQTGSAIGLDYDSLLAKLVVRAEDRAAAIARVRSALDAFGIDGVHTNLPLLRWIARDEAFACGAISTSFLAERLDESRFALEPSSREALLLGVAAELCNGEASWRMAGIGRPLAFELDGERVTIWASATAASGAWRLAGALSGTLRVRRADERIDATLDRESARGTVEGGADALRVTIGDRTYELRRARPPSASGSHRAHAESSEEIAAPMPGRVIRVAVTAGDRVEPNQLLVVLEAMKMEHRIEASLAATVSAVLVREGEVVSGGAPLIELA